MSIKRDKLKNVRKKLGRHKVARITRRNEFFRIRSVRRTYDRAQGKFSFNISYETAAEITPRTVAVAEAFGLGIDEQHKFTVLEVELKLGPQDIVYVTGDSGSGKSVLLNALRNDLGDEAVDLNEIEIETDRPLIETVGKSVEEGLAVLSKVGLNDAFLFLRTYNQLSDGQKYRYKIARMIQSKTQFWILDEFAATLDRDTAKIVSFNLQKTGRAEGKCIIAGTTHTDLHKDLNPSVHIHKRYGKEITVNYYPNTPAKQCTIAENIRIQKGCMADWKALACFHYRSHRTIPPRKIFKMTHRNELCGVIVYSYPPSTCFARRLVLPKMTMKQINKNLSTISRVVIHPKYRSIGLGAKLVKETLPKAGTHYVEMIAVMAKYNPFAENAGMKKIAEQPPPKDASRITQVLWQLGFNTQLLTSKTHVFTKLQETNSTELERIKEAFAKNRNIRFQKICSSHLPFGTQQEYKEKIRTANLDKLTRLIQVCGFLMQTKTYLFYKQQPIGQ